MKLFKKTSALLIALLLTVVVAFNIRLYYQPKFVRHGPCQLNQDLIDHLAHLKEKLHAGAASDMQQLFPEGFLFLNAVYGLSWAEVAAVLPDTDAVHREAMGELNWVLQELASEEARRPFNPELEPAYGIFYCGWSNYVLGRKLKLLPKSDWDTLEVQLFRQNCEAITEAVKNRNSPFPESYTHSCWPADMVVGMASVAIGEALFPGTYQTAIREWIIAVKARTDGLGLLPHSCSPENGAVLESARGSSQSLILNFLLEIDPDFARAQFRIYKAQFLDSRIGLPGIREYPKGITGVEDVDSGPVIWDIGGAASIVGKRTMALYGEQQVATGLRNSIETFGIGKTRDGKKKYLAGGLPVADGFIAWSNSVEACKPKAIASTGGGWRMKIQLLSLALFVLGGFAIFKLLKPKR